MVFGINFVSVFYKSNERSEYSCIGLGDFLFFFFQEKVTLNLFTLNFNFFFGDLTFDFFFSSFHFFC